MQDHPGLQEEWQTETTLYQRPHPRLARMAALLKECQPTAVLDVGCSTATLASLLPSDIEYFGCDVTDHAARLLPPAHFQQRDLNADCDLSWFADRSIDAIHIGGVFEYLNDPGATLAEVRRLLKTGQPLVTSITNFAAARYRSRSDQHRWWIYRPSLGEFQNLLAENGWRVRHTEAFLDRRGPRQWIFDARRRWYNAEHPSLLNTALQYLFVADAA